MFESGCGSRRRRVNGKGKGRREKGKGKINERLPSPYVKQFGACPQSGDRPEDITAVEETPVELVRALEIVAQPGFHSIENEHVEPAIPDRSGDFAAQPIAQLRFTGPAYVVDGHALRIG
jgi:hypothetical protein